MASNPIETLVNRRLLTEFLDADPVSIILFRPKMEKTAAGGTRKADPVPIPPQLFRLIPFKKRLTKQTRDTPDGNIVNLEYVLLGDHDADVLPGDYFTHDNGTYDVVSIEPDRQYRTAVNLTYRGQEGTWE